MDEYITRYLRVQIAHRAYFLDRHTLGHQLLLHGHDLSRIGLSDNFTELLFYKLRSSTRMQMLDNLLENRNPMCPIVNQFAHGILLMPLKLRD